MYLETAGIAQQSWGGVWAGLPENPKTPPMYVSPSINFVEGLHHLKMPRDRLGEERER